MSETETDSVSSALSANAPVLASDKGYSNTFAHTHTQAAHSLTQTLLRSLAIELMLLVFERVHSNMFECFRRSAE